MHAWSLAVFEIEKNKHEHDELFGWSSGAAKSITEGRGIYCTIAALSARSFEFEAQGGPFIHAVCWRILVVHAWSLAVFENEKIKHDHDELFERSSGAAKSIIKVGGRPVHRCAEGLDFWARG